MHEIIGDPQPSAEARQSLLKSARSTRDVYAQERTRTENQLYAAQQAVTALTIQLRIDDEKLTSLEDLIGELRTRMQRRGLATHPTVSRAACKQITRTIVTDAPLCESLGPSFEFVDKCLVQPRRPGFLRIR